LGQGNEEGDLLSSRSDVKRLKFDSDKVMKIEEDEDEIIDLKPDDLEDFLDDIDMLDD
jgi:hypothetical protein